MSDGHLVITGYGYSPVLCGISGRERDKLKKRKDAGGAVADGAGSGVPLPIPDGVKDEVKKPPASEVGVQADIDAKSCHLCFPMEEGYLNEIYQLLD